MPSVFGVLAKASVRRPGSSSRATDEARKSIHSNFEVPVPTVCLAGTAGVRKTEIEGTVRQARLADGRVLSSHAACTGTYLRLDHVYHYPGDLSPHPCKH